MLLYSSFVMNTLEKFLGAATAHITEISIPTETLEKTLL